MTKSSLFMRVRNNFIFVKSRTPRQADGVCPRLRQLIILETNGCQTFLSGTTRQAAGKSLRVLCRLRRVFSRPVHPEEHLRVLLLCLARYAYHPKATGGSRSFGRPALYKNFLFATVVAFSLLRHQRVPVPAS